MDKIARQLAYRHLWVSDEKLDRLVRACRDENIYPDVTPLLKLSDDVRSYLASPAIVEEFGRFSDNRTPGIGPYRLLLDCHRLSNPINSRKPEWNSSSLHLHWNWHQESDEHLRSALDFLFNAEPALRFAMLRLEDEMQRNPYTEPPTPRAWIKRPPAATDPFAAIHTYHEQYQALCAELRGASNQLLQDIGEHALAARREGVPPPLAMGNERSTPARSAR